MRQRAYLLLESHWRPNVVAKDARCSRATAYRWERNLALYGDTVVLRISPPGRQRSLSPAAIEALLALLTLLTLLTLLVLLAALLCSGIRLLILKGDATTRSGSIRRPLSTGSRLARVPGVSRHVSRHYNTSVFVLRVYTSFKRRYGKKVVDIWMLIDYCSEFSIFFYRIR